MIERADERDDQQLVDVYDIRKNCGHHGATEPSFDAGIGVPVPARVLLAVIWRNPSAVFDAVR